MKSHPDTTTKETAPNNLGAVSFYKEYVFKCRGQHNDQRSR